MENLTNTFLSRIEPPDAELTISDSKITGLKVRVGVSGTKTFYLFYKVAGKQRKYRIGKFGDLGVPAARKVAQDLHSRIARGEDVQTTRVEDRAEQKREGSAKLRAFLDDHYYSWIEVHQKNPIRTRQILESTFKHYMNKRMDQISKADMDKWTQGRLADGIEHSTINRCATVIIATLNRAVEWNIIKVNPLAGRKRLKIDTRGVVRYLSDDEEARLLKFLEKREGNIALLIPLLLYTGARPKEALSLTWNNVDLKARRITLLASFTKTGRTRYVPISDKLHATLSNQDKKSGWLFPNQKGTGSIVTIQKAWKNLKKDAEITDFRLYDLRHTFASKLAMDGAGIHEIAELLGHSSIDMSRIYAHLSPEHLLDVVNRI